MTTHARLDCTAVRARIQAFIDAELDDVACGEIEGHCSQCASCAALVAGLRETIGLCRQAGLAPLPEWVTARAREQARQLLRRR